ncbi:MAG: aldehyde dehydrogenase family protein [Fluviibacter sp.]
MMTGCCTLPPREAPAIPLWINGRPVLAMPVEFNEIRESATQRLIRQVPMVDQTLAATAIATANQAARLLPTAVPGFLQELDRALAELEAHFAGLSAVESHTHLDAGKADVANARTTIHELQQAFSARAVPDLAPGHSALLLAGPGLPVSAAIKLALPVLVQGGAVTLVPDADAPSCALALAELCGQCGLPDGLFNVVYVRDPIAAALVQEPGVQRVRLYGPSAWAQRWQAAALNWPMPCELVLA